MDDLPWHGMIVHSVEWDKAGKNLQIDGMRRS